MSSPPDTPLRFASPDDSHEELARAELYGLLARLWLAPPDAPLLDGFRTAVTQPPEPGGHLEAPWQALVAAMRATSVEGARDEFQALFGGVGRPAVFVYASYHRSGFLNEKPLAVLRQDLARLGLACDVSGGETEDHIACLFETMRYLIAGDDLAVCNLEQQRRFFRAHLQPWTDMLCDALDAQPDARLWRTIASMTRAFMQVEAQAFDLLEQS